MVFCTITDRNFLWQTLNLINNISLRKIYILALDKQSYLYLNKNKKKNQIIFTVNRTNHKKKKNQSKREYIMMLKPIFINLVLRNINKKNILLYLDSDTFIYSVNKIDNFFDKNKSIFLSKHDFCFQNLNKIKYGIFNAGVIGFRNDRIGNKAVSWWKKKCILKCKDYVDTRSFLDQKYLNQFLKLFSNIQILDKGINVAPWNLNNHLKFKYLKPIIYHFQSFTYLSPNFFYSGLSEYKINLNNKNVKNLYLNYAKKSKKNILKTKKIMSHGVTRKIKFLIKCFIKRDYILLD